MAGTASEGLPLNTSILLTVTGVSKCVEVKAHAALTVIPLAFGGVGVSVAYDLPVHVRACGRGALGLSENVEVRVWGPGLSFSDPLLAEGLKSMGFEAYSSERILVAGIQRALGGRDGFEAVLASVEGSIAVTTEAIKPLEGLVNSMAVIVRLQNPVSDMPWRLAELVGQAVHSLYVSITDTDELLGELTRIARTVLPHSMFARLCRGYACLVDYTGRFIVSIHDESDDELGEVASVASEYGDVAVSDIVVPPI